MPLRNYSPTQRVACTISEIIAAEVQNFTPTSPPSVDFLFTGHRILRSGSASACSQKDTDPFRHAHFHFLLHCVITSHQRYRRMDGRYARSIIAAFHDIDTDILARIVTRMSVSASWNAGFKRVKRHRRWQTVERFALDLHAELSTTIAGIGRSTGASEIQLQLTIDHFDGGCIAYHYHSSLCDDTVILPLLTIR